jgi:hypothetical protein
VADRIRKERDPVHPPDQAFSEYLYGESIVKKAGQRYTRQTWSAEEDAIWSRRVSEYDRPLTVKDQLCEFNLNFLKLLNLRKKSFLVTGSNGIAIYGTAIYVTWL